jgi:transcriptional regulator with XRE-family HTH domain
MSRYNTGTPFRESSPWSHTTGHQTGMVSNVKHQPVGPGLRRRQLARDLHELRLAAGLDTFAVAAEMRCHRSLISHYETGDRVPKYPDLKMLLQLYQAEDRLEDLGELRDMANHRGWWHTYKLPHTLQKYLGLEHDAIEVRRFTLELVPGMLQTEGYAQELAKEHPHPQDGDRSLEAKLRRQERLANGEVTLSVVMSEALLWRTAGMGSVGAEQLARIQAALTEPHVEVSVLPFTAGAHSSTSSAFTVLIFPADLLSPVVYQDHTDGSGLMDDQKVVDRMIGRFNDLRAKALDQESTDQLISKVMRATKRKGK